MTKRYKDILPYNWRTVKIPVENPKPGADHNKFVAMMQSSVTGNTFKIQPKCNQITSETQPKFYSNGIDDADDDIHDML